MPFPDPAIFSDYCDDPLTFFLSPMSFSSSSDLTEGSTYHNSTTEWVSIVIKPEIHELDDEILNVEEKVFFLSRSHIWSHSLDG